MKKFHGPKDYLDAARSLETTPDELDDLSNSEFGFVRKAVAANPRTRVKTLLKMIPEEIPKGGDDDAWRIQELALEIARNPNLTVELLTVLAQKFMPALDKVRTHHLAFHAGVFFCSDPRVPFSVIESIVNPERSTKWFRRVVARETKRKDVLELLAQDSSVKVTKKAQERLLELDRDTIYET